MTYVNLFFRIPYTCLVVENAFAEPTPLSKKVSYDLTIVSMLVFQYVSR